MEKLLYLAVISSCLFYPNWSNCQSDESVLKLLTRWSIQKLPNKAALKCVCCPEVALLCSQPLNRQTARPRGQMFALLHQPKHVSHFVYLKMCICVACIRVCVCVLNRQVIRNRVLRSLKHGNLKEQCLI